MISHTILLFLILNVLALHGAQTEGLFEENETSSVTIDDKADDAVWVVNSGNCYVDPSDKLCVLSPNFPNASDANESCSFTLVARHQGSLNGDMPLFASTSIEVKGYEIEWHHRKTVWAAEVRSNTSIEWSQSNIEEDDHGWRVCGWACSVWEVHGVRIDDGPSVGLWTLLTLALIMVLLVVTCVIWVLVACKCCQLCCCRPARARVPTKAMIAAEQEPTGAAAADAAVAALEAGEAQDH